MNFKRREKSLIKNGSLTLREMIASQYILGKRLIRELISLETSSTISS